MSCLKMTLAVLIGFLLVTSIAVADTSGSDILSRLSGGGFFSPQPVGPTAADYARAEKFLPQNAIPSIYNATVEPHWVKNSSLFWYINTAKTGTQYVLVNLTSQTKTVLSGRDELAALLSAAGDSTIDPALLSATDAVMTAEEQGLLVSPDLSKGVFLQNNNIYG